MCKEPKIIDFKKDILAEILFFSCEVRGDYGVIQMLCNALPIAQLDELLESAINEQCASNSISFKDIADFMRIGNNKAAGITEVDMDKPEYLSWYIACSLKQHNIHTINVCMSVGGSDNNKCLVQSVDGDFLFFLPHCDEMLTTNQLEKIANQLEKIDSLNSENEMLRHELLRTKSKLAYLSQQKA